MFEKALTDFWLYFATLDPFGTLIIFTGLTAGLAPKAKRKIALHAVLVATLVLIGFLALGQILLDTLQIRLAAFEIAGSIILFLFGLQMFFSPLGVLSEEQEGEAERDVAVFPLAVPSIASPGAILAVILATENSTYPIPMQLVSAGSLLLVIGLTLVLLLFADRVNRLIGKTGEKVLVRVSGLILAALACEFCIEAVEELLR
jgi:multiple antibiotic resistance protein